MNNALCGISEGYGERQYDADIWHPPLLEDHHQDGHHNHHNEEEWREDSHNVVGVDSGIKQLSLRGCCCWRQCIDLI